MNLLLVGEESAGIQTLRAFTDGVEFGDFRSVAKIAEYVDAHSPVLKV